MNKKWIVPVILSCILCLVAVSVSWAYITRSIETDNVISFGSLKMKLWETTLTVDGREVSVDPSLETDVMKSNAQSRIIRVENICDEDMFVRISIEMQGTETDGRSFSTEQYVLYNINQSDWVYHDGWYYYKHNLTAGLTSNELMTQIIFDIDKLTEDHPGCTLKLNVDAQAVQTAHQPIQNIADDYASVVGWPE